MSSSIDVQWSVKIVHQFEEKLQIKNKQAVQGLRPEKIDVNRQYIPFCSNSGIQNMSRNCGWEEGWTRIQNWHKLKFCFN